METNLKKNPLAIQMQISGVCPNQNYKYCGYIGKHTGKTAPKDCISIHSGKLTNFIDFPCHLFCGALLF